MSSIKVLVAGMDNAQNQLFRAVSRYPECEPIFTDKNSVNFSTNADIALLCRSCLSNNKFRAIRAAYNGKPLLITERGFSEVKEAFEDTLFRLRTIVKPVEDTLRVPAAWIDKKAVARKVDNFRIVNRVVKPMEAITKPAPPVYDSTRAHQVIKESHEAGLSAKDTLELLTADNLVNENGQPYTESYVWATRAYLKKKEEKTEHQTTTGENVQTAADQKITLINQVIEAPKLDPAQRLDIIKRINAGEISTLKKLRKDTVAVAGVMQLILTVEDFTQPSDEFVSVSLTKEAAMLVMSEIEAIKQFAVSK